MAADGKAMNFPVLNSKTFAFRQLPVVKGSSQAVQGHVTAL